MDIQEAVMGKSEAELNALIEAANAAKSSARQSALAELNGLIEQVKAKAKELGVNVRKAFVEPRVSEALYANPDNAGEVWNGLGAYPAWLKAKLGEQPKRKWKEAREAYRIAA